MDWDVFISHAWEDKDSFARPLAEALRERGLRVWFDEFTLTVGDSLRRSIDRGLGNSRYGIVVLSPSFFEKEWPQKELDGLAARELNGEKVILPVWHKLTVAKVRKHSPALADRVAVSSDKGLEYVVIELLRAIRLEPGKTGRKTKRKSNPRSEVDHEQEIRLKVRQYRFSGLHNLMKENYGAALDDFTHAIELDPENASMYCNRGLVYDHEGDNEKAILEYDRAIELDPKESELYYMRAKSYKSKGDLKAARRDLQRAAKMGDGRARKELENL